MANLARRAWALPLWAHAAALAVVLLALLPAMSPTATFTSDEGAYALQVRALQDGSWDYDYKAAPLDPEGTSFPIILSDGSEGHHYPYAKHPAFPLMLLGSVTLFGTALGLHLPGLIGVVGAAVAAWLLAKELGDERLARPAFWVAVSGPLIVSGFVVWAHAPSAALAGFALVGAARIARRGVTPGAAVLTVAAVVGGVFLRSEGLLFAGALAVGLAMTRLTQTGLLRREDGGPVQALVAGALVAVPAALAALADKAWVNAIVVGPYGGETLRGGGSTSFLEGRISGAWHELFQAHYLNPPAGPIVLVALVVAAGLGFLALRRWDPKRSRLLLAGAVGGTGLLLALRFAVHPHEAVTGLVTAWPVALLGILLFRWRGSGPIAAFLGVTVALFVAAILATQYPEAGGLEWGGRFLSPVLVPLAVLAAAGLARALDQVPDADRAYATTLVSALAAVTAVFALATAGSLRAREDRIVDALARHPATVTVTTRPSYPRIAWRADDRLSWMLTDEARMPALLEHLRLAGVAQVNVVVLEDTPVVGDVIDEPAVGDDGMKIVAVRSE